MPRTRALYLFLFTWIATSPCLANSILEIMKRTADQTPVALVAAEVDCDEALTAAGLTPGIVRIGQQLHLPVRNYLWEVSRKSPNDRSGVPSVAWITRRQYDVQGELRRGQAKTFTRSVLSFEKFASIKTRLQVSARRPLSVLGAKSSATLEAELRSLIVGWYAEDLASVGDAAAPAVDVFDSLLKVQVLESGPSTKMLLVNVSFNYPSPALVHLHDRINQELKLNQ